MSEGSHHHGGNMGGQQGVPEPGFQTGLFPPAETLGQSVDPSDTAPHLHRRGRRVPRRYRPRAGSPAWVLQWVAALAVVGVLAFIAYVAFHVI